MKIYLFKKRDEASFCGIIISDPIIQEIKAYKSKELYRKVTHGICCEPRKDFKKFLKNLKQGDFFKNPTSFDSLEDLEHDLTIRSYNSKSIEEIIVSLYELSFAWDQLDDSTSSMLFDYIPF